MEQEVYQLFAEIQTSHWWFVARRIILEDVLRRRLDPAMRYRIADVGCGTGALLPTLARFGETWGIDTSAEAVAACRRKGFTNVFGEDDPQWQGVRFDLMTFFDVLEHIEDDLGFLRRYLTRLRPGGLVLITVPAFQFLWSEHDELNHHVRRYTGRQLRAVITEAGLIAEKISYFNTVLFAPIAAVRWANRLIRRVRSRIVRLQRQPEFPGSAAGHSMRARTDFDRNMPALNGVLTRIFAAERFILRSASFPFGVSVMAIAHKPANGSAPFNVRPRRSDAATTLPSTPETGSSLPTHDS